MPSQRLAHGTYSINVTKDKVTLTILFQSSCQCCPWDGRGDTGLDLGHLSASRQSLGSTESLQTPVGPACQAAP